MVKRRQIAYMMKTHRRHTITDNRLKTIDSAHMHHVCHKTNIYKEIHVVFYNLTIINPYCLWLHNSSIFYINTVTVGIFKSIAPGDSITIIADSVIKTVE